MTDPRGPYRRSTTDPTPTDKLLILSAEVPPGGEYVQYDGDYKITVERRAGAPHGSGWYLVTATWGEEVAVYWTGTEWRAEVGMLDPTTIPQQRVDRLVLLDDIIDLLAAQPRVAMNLEQVTAILRKEFE